MLGNDWGVIRQQLGKQPGDAGYNIRYDVDGSGQILGNDWGRARERLGDPLPVGDPGPPPPASMWRPGDAWAHDLALALPQARTAHRLDASPARPSWSLWDEALLLATQELGESDDEMGDPLVESLLPALLLDFTRE